MLFFFGCVHLSAQCFPNGITFSTQDQIDNFAVNNPGCTEILGTLTIDADSSLDITNLNGLSQITSVNEGLLIKDCPGLTNLSGLENLALVENTLQIQSNANLETLNHLTSLEGSIGGNLIIDTNPSLVDLSGLESITSAENIRISHNENLASLTHLNSLTSVPGFFMLLGNDNIVNLSGLESLTSCGTFWLFYMNGLEQIVELSNLNEINGALRILNCDLLTSLEGLESIDSIGQNLEIFYTPGIHDLSVFSNLVYIGGSLQISFTDSLSDYSGLENLTHIGGGFDCLGNDSLINFSGLENLTHIGGDFDIQHNHSLEDFSGLESLSYIGEDVIIKENWLLSLCNHPIICDFILNGGLPEIENNNPGCNSINEILASCFGDYTVLEGQIIGDVDQNCIVDTSEIGIAGWLVNAYNDTLNITIEANELGAYWIPLPEGDWIINAIPPYPLWEQCFEDSLVQASGMGDSLSLDLVLYPQAICPFINWDFNMPTLRSCAIRTFSIPYSNIGVELAEDVVFSIAAGDILEIQNASIPYTVETDGTILFEIDSIGIFESGTITFQALVNCALQAETVECIDVEVLPNDLCGDQAWDGSTITASGYCENDSIHFELENIGMGDMSEFGQFQVEIIIDDIVLLLDSDEYKLDSGDDLMISYELEGMGLRLGTEQLPGHPIGETVSMVVPGCEDVSNDAILTHFLLQDGSPYMESFCNTVVASFDPNQKTASPIGQSDPHYIEKDWRLNYTLEFQNTGNDTAFLVVLRDSISNHLDMTTLQVNGGSHPFSWDISFNRELKFTFENILLPDSTTNEPASNGFVNFSIKPKADILPGTLIENRVGIFFDFNDVVLTNTVFHTIRKPVVTSSENLDWCAGSEMAGQTIWQDTSIQVWTEFIEYDSVHFLHLNVLPYSIDTVFSTVEIGTYLEQVLIESDTAFLVHYDHNSTCDSLIWYDVSTLTTIKNIKLFQAVKIFPNPVDDFLLVLDHQTNQAQQWKLSNNLGQVVWEKELKSNESLNEISMKAFPTGVYWLHVKTKTGTGVWKVIKT